MSKRIRTYFDTGVVLRACSARYPASIDATLELITDPQREIVVSLLLALELYPAAIEAKRSAEVAALESFFNMAAYRIPVDDGLMEDAINEASKIYTLGALDAAHIAAAKAAGCDEFITTEKPTKPMFKVRGIKIVHFS